MKLINKSILTAVITLSTASVYYAQQVQDTAKAKSKDIEEVILKGVTDIAKDRKTPVAVSTIKAAQILERQGNQELVEMLNTTPSVYATKGGGGFGDSQLTMRGFESRNIAVMVNGMPVNDMESGTVYMSNWTGLSDVTSTMQVQRGLGSSKLAIASVGGTMNFITRSADMKQGGAVRLGIGNNDFLKTSFAYNTGKSENGWAASFLMARQAGGTYVQNTDYESYTYFFALGYQPSAKHNLQFMITSSPQWHDQRSWAPTIGNYIKYNPDNDGTPYRQYNSDYGYYTSADGRRTNIANAMNYYSKPVMMLNWDWTISDKSTLSTVAYMSNGRGGGARNLGRVGNKSITDPSFIDAEGHYNYNTIFAANAAVTPTIGVSGNTLVRSSSVNSHNWYGILMNFQHKINDNWNFSIGTDDRYYYGYHYQVLSDLYGASGYSDNTNKNLATNNIVRNTYDYQKLNWNPFGGSNAPMEDRVAFSNDGEVLWYSGFGQVEYSTEKLTVYAQGSVSNQGYQRIDDFTKPGTIQQGQAVERKTGFKNLFGYNIKGGANYNIDASNNVFANIGYYSKQPLMSAVYPSNQQVVNPNLTNEKIFSVELGYGFKTANFNAKVNLYRTEWKDRWFRRGGVDFGNGIRGYSEISGITQLHQGVEAEATYRVNRFLELQGMFSWGDYKYKGNATGSNFQDDNTPILTDGSNTSTLYLDKVNVGGTNNSVPQTTSSLGFTVTPVTDLRIYGNWQYVGRIYSAMNMNDFIKPGNEALKLPDFNLFNIGASYKIKLKNPSQYFTLGVNVYNLFDTTYIQDGATNIKTKELGDFTTTTTGGVTTTAQQKYDAYQATLYKGLDPSNRVFFGFGRTWSTTLSFNF
ncbi:TonB-dependent receptor [Chryseobacterium sp. ES2]|uniref:TonB-dependent receptor n=1 Tax=Chryseobacterium metallicongregator TaxID=3073042 RepID=A0ABU1E662_9FLAO|nr:MULTISPECIES: TonB-dependent receptor [Chryseobacterium]MDR4953314.1 TonB-dependent receptor [Chryseobacterium sp. ES2]